VPSRVLEPAFDIESVRPMGETDGADMSGSGDLADGRVHTDDARPSISSVHDLNIWARQLRQPN